jgi:hypothetical protein
MQGWDKGGEKPDYLYKLITLEVEGDACEYLQMVNPSTGEIHVEGVEPGIKTVKQALAWRLNIPHYKDPVFIA